MATKLTEELVRAFQMFVEWILDMDFAPQQSKDLRSSMFQEWEKNERQSSKLVIMLLNIYDDILKKPSNLQESYRQQIQPKFIAQLRQEKANNQFAQVVIDAFDHHVVSPSPASPIPVAPATKATAANSSGATIPPSPSTKPSTLGDVIGLLVATAFSSITKQLSSRNHKGTSILNSIDLNPPINQKLYAINPQAAISEQEQEKQANMQLFSTVQSAMHDMQMGIINNIKS